MSVKERYIRRLLRDAKFYLNNIDGDDPQDPIGDVRKAGTGNHPVDSFVNHTYGTQNSNHEDSKNVNSDGPTKLGDAKFIEIIEEAEK